MKSLLLLAAAVSTTASNLTSFLDIRCGEPGTKLPTPRYGSDGIIFTVCTEQEIHAPIAKVYNTLLDFRNYHLWNSFVVDVEARNNSSLDESPAPVGFQMTLVTAGLLPVFNTTSDEIVTIAEPDLGINAWGVDDGVIQAEHPNVLVDVGGGVTRYVSYESYYGVFSVVLDLASQDALQRQFEKQGRDLKKYVEG